MPQVPGVLGAPVEELEKGLDIDLDGLVGSGLLATFRVTLVDGGRTMWLEDLPREALLSGPRLPSLPDLPDGPDADVEEEAPEPPPTKPGAKKPKAWVPNPSTPKAAPAPKAAAPGGNAPPAPGAQP